MKRNGREQIDRIEKLSFIQETLSPQMVESVVQRLAWFCLLCAGTAALIAVMDRWLQPDLFGFANSQIAYINWIAVVLVSVAMAVISKLRLLPPRTTLKLGLVYEVFVAFGISISETAVSLAHNVPVLGISRLALWIVITGVLIPNKPATKLAVAFISASTWPLAYILNLHVLKLQPVSMNRFALWIYIPFVLAFLIYFVANRIYLLTTNADNARELGSYHLISQIGSGGMGEVWRARHSMLARDAAIKLIRNDLMIDQPGFQSENRRQRFKQEAQVIASLRSPHTVNLFDFGVSQNGSFYYVMEMLDGISLQALVDKFGPLPASRLIYMMQQVCDSLEEAHGQGLIHRDIKPSNIFACKLGVEYDFIKVLDFGLAKNVKNSRLTQEGTSAGTPAYMAPEIAMGEDNIDQRVDIYGLGCTAYFALTGLPVFSGNTLAALAFAHVQKSPVPPSQRSEIQIPFELEQIILKCLAKKPEDRVQSARELRNLLGEISIPEWTQLDASSWWENNLPASSSYRTSGESIFADAQTISYPISNLSLAHHTPSRNNLEKKNE
jgi:serine/threonine-protein kinase